MNPLIPLERDYYASAGGYGSDDCRAEDSSDDERDGASGRMAEEAGVGGDEFEAAMNDALDDAFSVHASRLVADCARPAADGAESDFELDAPPDVAAADDDDDGDDDDAQKAAQEAADALYDPTEDDDNEAWVLRHRKAQTQADTRATDAALNCPACMALLCSDCQRHHVYKSQYRAMFVSNCRVDAQVNVFMPSGASRRARKRRVDGRQSAAEGVEAAASTAHARFDSADTPAHLAADDLFHPVLCNVCATEVGAFDKDEVYHFFNVLSSYS